MVCQGREFFLSAEKGMERADLNLTTDRAADVVASDAEDNPVIGTDSPANK